MWGRGGLEHPGEPGFHSYFEAEVPIFVSGNFGTILLSLAANPLRPVRLSTVTENLRSDDERGLRKTHITPYGAEVWAPNAPRNL